MENGVIKYGNVQFADIKPGSIVIVGDYYGQVAVGIVEEKRETTKNKKIVVRFGFKEENTQIVVIEENAPANGEPMYTLLEIVRSYA